MDVALDRGQSNPEALGDHARMTVLLDDGLDNAFAEIKGIGFHHESLSGHPITLQGALGVVGAFDKWQVGA